MTYLTGLLSKFGLYLIEKLFTVWANRIAARYKDYLEKKKQREIDQKNVDDLKKAIQGGTDADISKASEDLLNGRGN
jgi:hypothetical protein